MGKPGRRTGPHVQRRRHRGPCAEQHRYGADDRRATSAAQPSCRRASTPLSPTACRNTRPGRTPTWARRGQAPPLRRRGGRPPRGHRLLRRPGPRLVDVVHARHALCPPPGDGALGGGGALAQPPPRSPRRASAVSMRSWCWAGSAPAPAATRRPPSKPGGWPSRRARRSGCWSARPGWPRPPGLATIPPTCVTGSTRSGILRSSAVARGTRGAALVASLRG